MAGDSPASILFDDLGNPVGVILDGVIYRLQVQATITDGVNKAAITAPAVGNNALVTVTTAAASTTVSIAASISNVILLPPNTARRGATVFNDATTNLFIKLGTIASTSSYTVLLIPDAYYETPNGYTGEIDGIWLGSVGFARVTELT